MPQETDPPFAAQLAEVQVTREKLNTTHALSLILDPIVLEQVCKLVNFFPRMLEEIERLTKELERKDQRESEHCGVPMCEGCGDLFTRLRAELTRKTEALRDVSKHLFARHGCDFGTTCELEIPDPFDTKLPPDTTSGDTNGG